MLLGSWKRPATHAQCLSSILLGSVCVVVAVFGHDDRVPELTEDFARITWLLFAAVCLKSWQLASARLGSLHRRTRLECGTRMR